MANSKNTNTNNNENVNENENVTNPELTNENTNNNETANVKQEPKTTSKKEKTFVVCTPVKDFNGIVAGVHFAYGKAEIKEGWILEWFKEKGYEIKEK